MDILSLISPAASICGAIASICGGIYASRQAKESKAHADRAVHAAEVIAKTTQLRLAAANKRFFLEPRPNNTLRIHNPGIDNLEQIEVFSDQIPNGRILLSPIAVGEHKDIALVRETPFWGLMYFTITAHFRDGSSRQMDYPKADIRLEWQRE